MKRYRPTKLRLPCILLPFFMIRYAWSLSLGPDCTSTRKPAEQPRLAATTVGGGVVGRVVEGMATTVSATANSTSRLHLLSLQYTPPDVPVAFSETVTSVWRWKDAVLGNGQDYFVPKPKTLRALQDCIMTNCNVKEAVILSNCARLELLVVSDDQDPNELVSRELLHQVQYHRQNPHSIQLGLGLDVPSCIDVSTNQQRNAFYKTADVQELMRHWTHLTNQREIAYHVCLIAAGMATRPRRPARPVPFQPFSSRDAHVLLQLKRTLDISKGRQTSILLRGALEAGKAVRNVKIVPELQQLQVYGTGDNSKYSAQPPAHVIESVAQAASSKGIMPAVKTTLERLSVAQDEQLSQHIACFRQHADALATTADEQAWIRKRIHESTMLIRTGRYMHMELVLDGLHTELELFRERYGQPRE